MIVSNETIVTVVLVRVLFYKLLIFVERREWTCLEQLRLVIDDFSAGLTQEMLLVLLPFKFNISAV